jgi:quercetin dioxygenase-like cupin family protein/ligand-binding sensor protein
MDWGFIEFLSPPSNFDKSSLNVGITTLFAGKHFPHHIHYGHEQVIYIIEGEGVYIINGEVKRFSEGMLFHLPAEASHETFNTGDKAIRELFISSSVKYDAEIPTLQTIKACTQKDMLSAALGVIQIPFFTKAKIPFVVLDENWDIAFQNDSYFPFCLENCRPTTKSSDCPCYSKIVSKEPTQFICPYGLTVYYFPIIIDDNQIASLIGGHFLSQESDKCVQGLFAQPDSTVTSIRNWLNRVAQSIDTFCEFYNVYHGLNDKNVMFQAASEKETTLLRDLSAAQNIANNLRIDYHFLFNTLNTIASMTIENEREDIYNAIIDLSKMLRYNMNTNQRMIELRDELDYLKLFIHMQELRFRNSFLVDFNIDSSLERIKVPFNFLQPIVENAFVHGVPLSESKPLKVIVTISKRENTLDISIYNDGKPLTAAEKERIRRLLNVDTGQGLSLIHQKLADIYGTHFLLDIDNVDSGVCVNISFPIS